MNDLIQQLAAAVTAMGPTQDVELAGSWSTSKRKTYKSGSQAGSGAGPFVEVLDARWRATLKCAVPIVGFAFMDTPTRTFWVKSIAPAVAPHVEVSLHAHAEFLPGRASFAGSLFDAVVPAVPVACGENPIQTCTLGPAHTKTGSAHGVARVNGVAFVILLLPKTFVKVGRNRLCTFGLNSHPCSTIRFTFSLTGEPALSSAPPLENAMRSNPRLERTGARQARFGRARVGAGRSTAGR